MLRQRFEEARGYWNPFWDDLLDRDPDYFEAYIAFSAHPWRHGVLEPKIKELIYIAIDASTTHLHEAGLRQHLGNAIRYGATAEEIMEVLEITSGLGIQSCTVGMRILLEETGEPRLLDPASLSKAQEKATSSLGGWNEALKPVLELDPLFLNSYSDLMAVPNHNGSLDSKILAFVNLALNASPTHLYEPGIRQYVHEARQHGATVAELIEIFELCSGLGIHTCLLALPLLHSMLPPVEES